MHRQPSSSSLPYYQELRWSSVVLVLVLLAGIALLLAAPVQASPPDADPAAETVLYDGAASDGTQTPDQQGFNYLATSLPFTFPLNPPEAATQSATGGIATLDTSVTPGDYAGYTARAASMPDLSVAGSYTLTLTLQVVSENHASDNRAGFSLILLNNDAKGIELGFWEDEIWSQRYDSDETDFIRDPGTLFDTTTPTTYHLAVKGDAYRLSGDEEEILRGSLRDYSGFQGTIDPYETPNFLFLGDNTSSSGATIRLSSVALTVAEEPEPDPAPPSQVLLPLVLR